MRRTFDALHGFLKARSSIKNTLDMQLRHGTIGAVLNGQHGYRNTRGAFFAIGVRVVKRPLRQPGPQT